MRQMQNKAENRAQFEAIWKEHFANCRLLVNSLPLGKEALEFLELCKQLEAYVEKASDFTYGPVRRVNPNATPEDPCFGCPDKGTEKCSTDTCVTLNVTER
jgi:hypothetical protein